ncbi:MAG TPA: beta-phosphoglucomutase family hydrolase [Microlunatus sp.]
MAPDNPRSLGTYAAVLFDLDGVLTPTAEVHMRAWQRMFTDFLTRRGDPTPYTDQDYYDYVDGKPRYDGVRSFLDSRGIELPEGSPDDPSEAETVCGLGNRKNDEFSRVLETDGVQPYPGSVRLLDRLADDKVAVAVVSSSRNARPVLRAAGLLDRFTVIVDGNVADERSLPGKPAPDTFLAAAGDLGAPVERAVVMEDASSGVAAGRAGGFGLVVGVDRGAGADRLIESGADIVVADLGELVTDGPS